MPTSLTMPLRRTPRAARVRSNTAVRCASLLFIHLSLTFILGKARVPELWIRPALQQQTSPLLVVEDTAKPIALSRGGEHWRDSSPANRIYVHAEIDELGQERIPAAIGRAEQRVLAEGSRCLRI